MTNVMSELKDRDYTFQSDKERKDYIKYQGRADELSGQFSGGWFKAFVTAVKNDAKLDGLIELDISNLDSVDKAWYADVKEMLVNEDMDSAEKNRVTNFHRSAKSVIRKGIINGYPFMDKDIDAIAKSGVESFCKEVVKPTVTTQQPTSTTTSNNKKISLSESQLVEITNCLREINNDGAIDKAIVIANILGVIL